MRSEVSPVAHPTQRMCAVTSQAIALPAVCTKERSHGPITKREWSSIAEDTIKDPTHDLILHTDRPKHAP
eukprot:925934-Amphidinium_carterae.2